MTAAYRLKGVGWLIAAVVIALAFYLVSLRVAEERKRLEAVNARIAAAQRDIRALETEFDTRANLVQLERWNGDTLALAAPTAGQFVRDASQLATIDVAGPRVQTAALVVPSIAAAPVAAVAAPLPSLVARPAPVRVAAVALDPAARTPVVKAVHAAPPVPDRALARLANVERTSQAVAKVRPQAIAMLDDKLLSDATLGDLIAKAKREARQR
nr:hypothetical protein [Sphingomonas bacterium]